MQVQKPLMLVGFVLVVSMLVCVAIFEYRTFSKQAPLPTPVTSTTPDQQAETVTSEVFSTIQTNVENPAMPSSLVVIYSTTASSTMTENRLWQNLAIWKKVGNAAPSLVGKVGAIGEYAASEVVSPTHNYVAVNLEQAVDIIDLTTNKKRRVFTTTEWVIGVAFAQDGKKLIISDGATFAANPIKKIHTIDLATGTDTVFAPHDSQIEMDPIVLRKDGILLYNPVSYKDCGSSMEAFSFTTNMSTLAFEEYSLSDDGMVALGKESASLPNTDDGMCGSGFFPTIVSVVEPVTGKVLGQVGRSGEPLTLVSFSPDDTKVLFKTSTDQKIYTYYLQDVSASSTPMLVLDPNTLLASWKAHTGPVTYRHSYELGHSLYVGDKPIFVSDQSPTLIAQYFQ